LPYTASNEIFLIALPSLLWLLDLMATYKLNFALHFAIALESTGFTDLGSNILKTRHIFVVLISVSSRRAKQEDGEL